MSAEHDDALDAADDLPALYEAVLFVAERPLSSAELGSLAGVPALHAEAALSALEERLADDGRGLRVQRHGDAWQLVTAPELAARLAEYASREEARLSPAALEALAVVAYRQPCTRADVERVRGVDSDYVIRSLLHRRLIAEIGRRDAPGRPALFGTTFAFLERFGLTSLDELPPLSSAAAQLAADGDAEEGPSPAAEATADASADGR